MARKNLLCTMSAKRTCLQGLTCACALLPNVSKRSLHARLAVPADYVLHNIRVVIEFLEIHCAAAKGKRRRRISSIREQVLFASINGVVAATHHNVSGRAFGSTTASTAQPCRKWWLTARPSSSAVYSNHAKQHGAATSGPTGRTSSSQ